MMRSFFKGQRWVSSTEPELGLGTVAKVTNGRVAIQFPARKESRVYAPDGAPLKRVQFGPGETIETRDGRRMRIEEVREKRKLLVYFGQGTEILESDLSDTLSFSRPEDRLLAGQMDDMGWFSLRYETLLRRHRWASSPVRGFQGARISLIPHQLYVASEVSSRYLPRVLLADEVGLGKTIEAGLILHRLILSGRVSRALVMVPSGLLHQWFVELRRKFQLEFHLFDEERCRSIEGERKRSGSRSGSANPFLEEQLVLLSPEIALASKKRQAQLAEAPWDMLIVDEAHHLEWSRKRVSPDYRLVEELAGKVQGLLLLTATPEQLGREGHFARLRLLDPERYVDLDGFLGEARHYEAIAELADRLLNKQPLRVKDVRKLRGLFSHYEREEFESLVDGVGKGNDASRSTLVDDLIDQHGTGRVMFRNRRLGMHGFPERRVQLLPLSPVRGDARIKWLAAHLQEMGPAEKVLLITSRPDQVLAIQKKLSALVELKVGVFHEDLTLMQRDRNATWFAEPDGAQLLICSEIGSEGRNFQFAHRLVLMDLPLEPSLLEQRIGRLDRIGQTETILIQVPYVEGSGEEVLARWYHEGLGAFEHCLHAGHAYRERFGTRLDTLIERAGAESLESRKLEALLADTRKFHAETSERLEQGRDHLLELNSFRKDRAAEIERAIREADADAGFEKYCLRLFDHFGVTVEDMDDRTYLIKPDHLYTADFPAIPREGLLLTMDREQALRREDIAFFTPDHPMVQGAMELLLGSERGNASFAFLDLNAGKMIFLEAIYVVECVADIDLHMDRFLPPTPLRFTVNHRGEDFTEILSVEEVVKVLREGKARWLQKNAQALQTMLPRMKRATESLAGQELTKLTRRVRRRLHDKMVKEVERVRHLEALNRHVGAEELRIAEDHLARMEHALESVRLRPDSLRILFKEDD